MKKWKISHSFIRKLDTNNRLTDSNVESNWKVPKVEKVAKNKNFQWRNVDESEQKVMILETSKTNGKKD